MLSLLPWSFDLPLRASVSEFFLSGSILNSFGASEDGVDVVLFNEISDVVLPVDDDLDRDVLLDGGVSFDDRFCSGKCSPFALFVDLLSGDSLLSDLG